MNGYANTIILQHSISVYVAYQQYNIKYSKDHTHLNTYTYSTIHIVVTRLKYIMLLKLPIILSRNSFNFYLLFPTFYYKSMQICYKNHNILLIKHKTYHLLYSQKISRATIFEDFKVFCSTSKILSSHFQCQKSRFI